MKCSACSGSLKPAVEITFTALAYRGLQTCRRCGGLQGTIYRGEAIEVIGLGLPMLAAASSPEALRYFDLTVLGSQGVERIHGWYDTTQHRVVQYG